MNELTIILILVSFLAVVIIFNVIFYNKVCGIAADRVVDDSNREQNSSNQNSEIKESGIPKYASPLAFDDRILCCKSLEEINTVAACVERLILLIDHIWHPQELLQLLLLLKNYLDDHDLKYMLTYQYIRYMETLVLHLNRLNVNLLDSDDYDEDIYERKIIFDEINHCYNLAKDFKEHYEKLKDDNLNSQQHNHQNNVETVQNGEEILEQKPFSEDEDNHDNDEDHYFKDKGDDYQNGFDLFIDFDNRNADSDDKPEGNKRTYRKVFEIPESDSIRTKTEDNLIDADKRLIEELKKREEDEEDIPDSVKNYSPL